MKKFFKAHLFLGISIIIAIIAEVLGFKVTAFAAAAASLKPAIANGASNAGVAQQLSVIAKELSPAKPAASLGNWLAPIFYLAAFAFLAIGALHIDVPDKEGKRKKFNPMGIGIISLLVGLMWWPYIIAMMVAQGLGPLTNFVAGLIGMFSFFFMALGLTILMKVPAPSKQLGPVAIMLAWFVGVYAYFFLSTPAPGGGVWMYHFSIALVLFVAMNAVGLYILGIMKSEKLLGWILIIAGLYSLAIPAVLWSLPAGMQGPF
ncbi:MAG: hypothetical protein ACYCSQ_04135 [bacterium]